jgi:proline racemase
LKEGENFYHRGITGTEFVGRVEGTTKVGEYPAILPSVEGQAWITSFKQVVLDHTDPFPEGFRVGDTWHLDPEE